MLNTTQPPQRSRPTPGALLFVCTTCGAGRHDVPPGAAASHGLCPGCLLDLDPEAHAEVHGDVGAAVGFDSQVSADGRARGFTRVTRL